MKNAGCNSCRWNGKAVGRVNEVQYKMYGRGEWDTSDRTDVEHIRKKSIIKDYCCNWI